MVNTTRWALVLALLAVSACTPGRAPTPIPSEGPRSFFSAAGRIEERDLAIDAAHFSPNGNHLALLIDNADGSRLALARAGKISVGRTNPLVEVNDFAWMPDGESVLIAYHPPLAEPATPYFDSLAIVNLRGEILRKIPTTKKLRVERSGIAVAPDGNRAFVGAGPEGEGFDNTDLHEVELATGTMRQLTRTPITEDTPRLASTNRVIFVLSEQDRARVAALDLKTGRVTKLSPPNHVLGRPSVPYNGDTIIYDAYPAAGAREQRAIRAIDVAGGEPRKVLDLDAVQPSLHPDGVHAVVHVVGGIGAGYLKLVTI